MVECKVLDDSVAFVEPPMRAQHRKLKEEIVDIFGIDGDINTLNITSVSDLQVQFKKWSAILSIVRHYDPDSDTTDLNHLKPIDVPDDISDCRRFLHTLAPLEKYEGLLKKYVSMDLAEDPGKMSVLSDDVKSLRTQNARLVVRVVACLSDITNITVQNCMETAIASVGSMALTETALGSVSKLADARRRLGNKVKALNTSQSLMKLMESILHVLSMHPKLIFVTKHALIQLSLLLLRDKERADEDVVDINSVISGLVEPYLNGPGPAEWYLGVMALYYFYIADRVSIKDYVLLRELSTTLLSVAASPSFDEPRLQSAALTLIVGLTEYNEIRMQLLHDGIIEILSDLAMMPKGDIKIKTRVAACLARLSLHDDQTRHKVFTNFGFFDMTKEVLLMLDPQDLDKAEAEELTQLVLEVVFFLSLHSSFKAQLLTALAPTEDSEAVIKTVDRSAVLKAPLLVKSLPKFGLAAVTSNNPLAKYTYCGIINNLTRSSSDKDKIKRVPGMPDWDDSQMEQVQLMMDKLPDKAKPVANGQFDRGDDSLVSELVSTLVDSGALNHVCKIIASPSVSPSLAAIGSNAIRQCITKQEHQKYKGELAKIGGFTALLNTCAILEKDKQWNIQSKDELRLIRQALAKLAMGVNPKSMSYREQLSLVPQMMTLLEDRHQLFNYEACLVLTNITSLSEDVRNRVFLHKDGWRLITSCAFEENELLRAAGCELMANMCLNEKLLDAIVEGRFIHDIIFLLACCQEVTNDRCLHASAGALAMMSQDARVGVVILEELRNLDSIFEVVQICVAKSDPALLVRIAVFIRNVIQAGVEQYQRDGSRYPGRQDLSKHWQKVQTLAEFVLSVLSKDLNALVASQEVVRSFKEFKQEFLSALNTQRAQKK